MARHDDLSGLIKDVERSIDATAVSARAARPARRKKFGAGYFLPAFLFLLAWYISTLSPATRLDNEAIQLQLVDFVTRAKADVDANTQDGIYPPVLPNAALAAIVNYEVQLSGYLLWADMRGVHVEMNQDGVLQTLGAGN